MNDERSALAALLDIVREYGLDTLRLRVGNRAYELVARTEIMPGAQAAPPGDAPASVPTPEPHPPRVAPTNMKKVGAPIIGVFYRSAAPGTESFVEVGDRVVIGQPLCILEAMKLMNEITSDYAGVVRRILPENGALVSLGEEMFWIEP